jgi:hypothetical protein
MACIRWTNLFIDHGTLCELNFATGALRKDKDALLLTVDNGAVDVANGKTVHLETIARFNEFCSRE